MTRATLPPAPPIVLQDRSTDEFVPPPSSDRARRAMQRVIEEGPESAKASGHALGSYWAGRQGTAAGLLALNQEFGERYYEIPDEAARDIEAAAEALDGDELVIDVQTHYVAERSASAWTRSLLETYRSLSPDWWTGLDDWEAHSLAEYLRCVYLESETDVAVLTSAPGLDDTRMLWNHEMAGTREMLERLGAEGRMLNHCVVHPDAEGALDKMAEDRDRYRPSGWKVYTIGHMTGTDLAPGSSWWLDDERVGIPFLERVRALGNPIVCAHKGISALVPTGSPRDVGPAALAFPDIEFLIYHSAYEMPTTGEVEEGPWTEETRDIGVNRLVTTLRDSKIAPGSNVYAELGSTWFCLIRRPDEAAHVLGKLLLAVGEDNILWGSDSIWFGPTQPAIDALRTFQIPLALREEFGYPELTPQIKAKILGLNAARVYGVDPQRARERSRSDDMAWVRSALDEYDARGIPSL
ncbi:MAG: amidohydrolase family protein [Deltaproteobacteria bacterium]|jgi:predicted TIM-barrel fold metal-dependent hydrolase|nr:amidohydrolase family protein [Deltaproteobacteria bacterium]